VHGTPWAHIDIAAVTFDKKDRPLTGSGFTGFGVRLLNAFLNDVFRGHVVFRKEGGHD
jgi:leucyl aminopeptidase